MLCTISWRGIIINKFVWFINYSYLINIKSTELNKKCDKQGLTIQRQINDRMCINLKIYNQFSVKHLIYFTTLTFSLLSNYS